MPGAGLSWPASAHADALNLLRMGLAARMRGDLNGAIHHYTQAIDTGELTQLQLAVVLNSRGVAYDMTGEPDKAIADFNAAIQINAEYGEAYVNRGLAWAKKRDYDRAEPPREETAIWARWPGRVARHAQLWGFELWADRSKQDPTRT